MSRIRKIAAGILSLVLLVTTLFSGNLGVQATEMPDEDLVLHCTFDLNGGDISSYQNETQEIGMLSYVDGVLGYAAKFDGKSYIDVNCKENFDALRDGYTFSVWLYLDENRPSGEQPILQKKGDPSEENPSFLLAARYFEPCVEVFTQYENVDTIYGPKVELQKWTLLTVTYDLQTVKFYENGILKANKQVKGSVPITTGNVQIGFDSYDGSSFFKGLMDELRVYSKVLTPLEVKGLYAEGAASGVFYPPADCVAYYSFNDTLADLSGYKNDGIAVGNISYAKGISGNGAKFDGNSYIEVNDSDSLDLTGGYTFSLWRYKEDIGINLEQPILLKQGNSVEIEESAYVLSDSDNQPYVQVYTTYGSYENMYVDNTFEKRKWDMLTVTYDGKSIKYYKNGVIIGTKPCLGSIPGSSGKLLIGFNEYDGSSFFKGMMDELRIYNFVLTPEQIKALYNPPSKSPTPTAPPAAGSSPSPWAAVEVERAKALKLTTDKVLKNYQGDITREELAELSVKLYEALSGKAAEKLLVNPFTDTTNQEVLKAFNLKIMEGVSADKFNPSGFVTQSELLTMSMRTINAALPGLVNKKDTHGRFIDANDIIYLVYDELRHQHMTIIQKGASKGAIAPQTPINGTRELAIIYVKRVYENFSRYRAVKLGRVLEW